MNLTRSFRIVYNYRKIVFTIIILITLINYHKKFKKGESPFFNLLFNDKRLIEIIRERYILPPSTEDYNLIEFSSSYESLFYKGLRSTPTPLFLNRVLKLLFEENESLGFYVDVGAGDGEMLSHSLYLEMVLKWEGLLIEPNGKSFNMLKNKKRKVYVSNLCIGERMTSYMGILQHKKNKEGIDSSLYDYRESFLSNSFTTSGETELTESFDAVECVPLYSMFLALNIAKIDLIILDINKREENVIRNFPFDKTEVNVWIVKHKNTSPFYPPETIDFNFIERFSLKGYECFALEFNELYYIMINKTWSSYKTVIEKRPKSWRKIADNLNLLYPAKL